MNPIKSSWLMTKQWRRNQVFDWTCGARACSLYFSSGFTQSPANRENKNHLCMFRPSSDHVYVYRESERERESCAHENINNFIQSDLPFAPIKSKLPYYVRAFNLQQLLITFNITDFRFEGRHLGSATDLLSA